MYCIEKKQMYHVVEQTVRTYTKWQSIGYDYIGDVISNKIEQTTVDTYETKEVSVSEVKQ